MVELVIKGTEDLEKLARVLKQIGAGSLRRELARALRTATARAPQMVKGGARTLPSRGGLAALIAASRVTSVTRTQGSRVSVKVEARNQYNLQALDRGQVHHPLYGDKRHWYTQAVPAGWFTRPAKAMGNEIHVEVSRSLKAFADKHLSN